MLVLPRCRGPAETCWACVVIEFWKNSWDFVRRWENIFLVVHKPAKNMRGQCRGSIESSRPVCSIHIVCRECYMPFRATCCGADQNILQFFRVKFCSFQSFLWQKNLLPHDVWRPVSFIKKIFFVIWFFLVPKYFPKRGQKVLKIFAHEIQFKNNYLLNGYTSSYFRHVIEVASERICSPLARVFVRSNVVDIIVRDLISCV